MAVHQWKVDRISDGMRVDACILKQYPEMTVAQLQECFRHRDVKLDGVRVKNDVHVKAGQEIIVYFMETGQEIIDVVYEDDDVLLVNKKQGISVEPDEKSAVSLTEMARRYVQQKYRGEKIIPRPCHRLDNKTCGIVVFAKNDRAEEVLKRIFKLRTLDKRYVCLVKGKMKPAAATCRAYLVKDAKNSRVTILDHEVRDSKPIITEYETLDVVKAPSEGIGDVSRLSVHLITGRTHQIRAHLSALGHPILGDDVYGDRQFNHEHHARRLMLCAQSLILRTGGELPNLDNVKFEVKCPF